MDYFFMQNKLKYKTLRTPIENEELIRKAFLRRFFVLALQKHRWTKVGQARLVILNGCWRDTDSVVTKNQQGV